MQMSGKVKIKKIGGNMRMKNAAINQIQLPRVYTKSKQQRSWAPINTQLHCRPLTLSVKTSVNMLYSLRDGIGECGWPLRAVGPSIKRNSRIVYRRTVTVDITALLGTRCELID